jgi:hypothetical protein
VSAAFALAAQVHAVSDPTRARTELATGAAIYALAKTASVGELVTAFPHSFYPEDAWADDMAFGGVELHLAAKALGDGRAATWLTQSAQYARQYLDGESRDSLNLYDVSALAHTDLVSAIGTSTGFPVTRAELVSTLEGQLDAGVARAAADRFRGGAVYSDYDSTSFTLGLIAQAVRYRDVTGSTRYAAFAQQQANWVLGGNPWGVSLIVGVGSTFSKCPHHQIANLAGSGAVLTGAAVNGPNGTGVWDEFEQSEPPVRACPADGVDRYAAFTGNGARFMDHVDSWMSNEPAIDFTSTGLLAFALLGRDGSAGTGPAAHSDTIGVFRPSDHKAYLRTTLTAGANDVPAFPVGSGAQVPVVGDWDGDGKDGLGYYDPATRSFHLRNALDANGGADLTFVAEYAASGDVPIAGDWDGDGKDTVGTWRPGDRLVRLRNSNTAGPAEVTQAFGKASTTILTGDWDGDGRDSLGYYEPADRTFHLRNALVGTGGSDFAFTYGAIGDLPLTGDWNADGKDTVGVWRPSTKEWNLRDTNAGGDADLHFAYGTSTDRPLVGDWRA